ncbi:hypothetical protein O181_005454 [Austropuccinia psidii MF-1]|uniref:Uncharacterized protein n=1 Tax=Austropuccinia psidii MF-1 TaxID=1389203 RepID=A0A9Q3BI53_9BASI|nr:hypothetical protein [Austropuccinia psidii MF-1]
MDIKMNLLAVAVGIISAEKSDAAPELVLKTGLKNCTVPTTTFCFIPVAAQRPATLLQLCKAAWDKALGRVDFHNGPEPSTQKNPIQLFLA